MKIKSAGHLRKYIQEEVGGYTEPRFDCDFIGNIHGDVKTGNLGFFKIYHGIADDIVGHLQGTLKMAEDGQAIHEFIQNAVDCGSTAFWIYHNSEYFVAINNGAPFNKDQIASILNTGQSEKRKLNEKDRCDKIGRFGIGFNLIHRLVGEDDGISELTELKSGKLKGPILFSWFEECQLKQFFEQDFALNSLDQVCTMDSINPWMFKILLTCFPAGPGDTVKDLNYQDFVPFPVEDLQNLSNYIKNEIPQLFENFSLFKRGSMFIIELGKDKGEQLDRESKKIDVGLNYSMNFFRQLDDITINNKKIRPAKLNWFNHKIQPSEERFNYINPEYKVCPISISVGFSDTLEEAFKIKLQPNFYKYFPCGDEVNGLGFIIHCDAFDIEGNRRKLQYTNVNQRLIEYIARFIIVDAKRAMESNFELYKHFFQAILISDNNEGNTKNALAAALYKPLMEILKKNVVTADSTIKPPADVRIKSFDFNLDLEEVGLHDLSWFSWTKNDSDEICERAEDLLDIPKWGIRDLIPQIEDLKLSKYLFGLKKEEYKKLISELKKEYFLEETKWKLRNACWILTNDGKLTNIESLQDGSVFLLPELDQRLIEIFRKLGKDSVINECKALTSIIDDLSSLKITDKAFISQLLASENSQKILTELTVEDRQRVVQFLKLEPNDLVEIPLFKSKTGKLKPLNRLIRSDIENVPPFLDGLCIDKNEQESFSNDQLELLVSEDLILKNIFFEEAEFNEITSFLTSEKLEELFNFVLNLKEKYPSKNESLDYELVKWVPQIKFKKLHFSSPKEVYVPDSFLNLIRADYTDVKSAIESMTELVLPEFPYLNLRKELNLRYDSSLDFISKIHDQTYFDVIAFNSFLDWVSSETSIEDFTGHFIFSVSEGKVHITKNEKTINYYSEDEILLNFIEEHDKTGLLNRFPSELYDKKRGDIGLLTGDTLIKELVELRIGGNELARFLNDETVDEIKKDFIAGVESLHIDSSIEYTANDIEHHMVSVAYSVLKDLENNQLESFRPKVWIDEEPLIKKSLKSDLYFNKIGEIEKITLIPTLPQILEKYSKQSFSLDKMIICFSELEKKRVVEVFKKKPKNKKDLYSELLDSDHEYFTPQQTLFLCLYTKSQDSSLPTNKPYLFEERSNDEEKLKALSTFLDLAFKQDPTNKLELEFPDIEELQFDKINLSVDWALPEEKPKKWLSTWLESSEKDTKVKFLIGRGAVGENAEINLLREKLKKGESVATLSWKEIDNSFMLANTLSWLAQLQIEDESVNLKRESISPLYEQALNLNLDLQIVPLPSINSVGSESYVLRYIVQNGTVFISDDHWKSFQVHLIDYLDRTNGLLVDDLISKENLEKYFTINSDKISLDIDSQQKKAANPLDLPFYLEWELKDKIEILVVDQPKLQFRLNRSSPPTNRNGVIQTVSSVIASFDSYAPFFEGNKLFLPSSMVSNFPETSLKEYFDQVEPGLFDSLLGFKTRFLDSKSTTKVSNEERIPISDEQARLLKDFFGEELSDDDKKNWNLFALVSALEELPEEGYDVKNATGNLAESRQFAQLDPVVKDDQKLVFMVRSGMQGILYLTKSAWDRLSDENVKLYVQITKNSFEIFDSKQDLASRTSKDTDFQILRIESEGSAENIDAILNGSYKDKGKTWLTFLLRQDADFTRLFYHDYQAKGEKPGKADISSLDSPNIP